MITASTTANANAKATSRYQDTGRKRCMVYLPVMVGLANCVDSK